jgi:hypothetical protein
MLVFTIESQDTRTAEEIVPAFTSGRVQKQAVWKVGVICGLCPTSNGRAFLVLQLPCQRRG